MDRNFFIALGVALVAYVGYSYIFPPKDAQSFKRPAIEQSAALPSAVQEIKTQNPAVQNPAQQLSEKPAIEAKEELFNLSTKEADIVFTSRGAAVKSFIFKDIIAPVDLTPYKGSGYFATLPDVNFTRVEEQGADIAFKAVFGGIEVYKKYIFSQDGGINKLELKLVNTTEQPLKLSDFNLALGPGLATVKSEESENPTNWRAVCLVQESGKKKPTLNKITQKIASSPQKLQEECADWQWAGIDNRYFLAAVVPQNWKTDALQLSFSEKYVYSKPSFWGLFGTRSINGPQLNIALPSEIPAKGEVSLQSDFYFGPKDYDKLESLPFDFSRAIQFGFFGQFGKWARNLLEWLYGITKNYGTAIILMTFLIQICLFPLTYKQLKSSAVMSKLAPEMKRIQEKYKGDPALQQREMMALYKKYGANPLSGCLPLFIQFPIFIALFNALRTSWTLHGSPFIWWIHDLSAKDPYYVLPVAMGIMMFIQQKLTMPDMAKDNPSMAMMKWMPVFMTVIFLNFPAGLTLYWFVSNCISFVINLVLKRKLAQVNA